MILAGLIQVNIQYNKIYPVYHLAVPGVNTTWLGSGKLGRVSSAEVIILNFIDRNSYDFPTSIESMIIYYVSITACSPIFSYYFLPIASIFFHDPWRLSYCRT